MGLYVHDCHQLRRDGKEEQSKFEETRLSQSTKHSQITFRRKLFSCHCVISQLIRFIYQLLDNLKLHNTYTIFNLVL